MRRCGFSVRDQNGGITTVENCATMKEARLETYSLALRCGWIPQKTHRFHWWQFWRKPIDNELRAVLKARVGH